MATSTSFAPDAPEWADTSPKHTGARRDALVDAAKRLLPDHAPSTITGRNLAAEANVNYGLVHHYFGSKDAALVAGLRSLRDDFVTTHGDAATMPLLTASDPYLRAIVRFNIDAPGTVSPDDDFPIGAGLVAALDERVGVCSDDGDPHVQAQARAIAMISMQLCFAVLGPELLEATGVGPNARDDVQSALASLYDSLAMLEHDR